MRINRKTMKLFKVKKPSKSAYFRWGIRFAGFILFSMLVLFLLVYFGAFGKLPSAKDIQAIRNYTASEIYTEDNVLLGKYYVENRINAAFEELSPNIINALVATEDARFFEHKGIDTKSLLRVFFKTLLSGDRSSGGGSTLSQQLAKNIYHRHNYRFLSMPINKVREMVIARRLEKEYTKEELLDLYLNTVSFSENIFGVRVAAKRFFGASTKDIKVEQAAVLIAMLKAPSSYNPVTHPKRSLKRRNSILNKMKKYGYLDEDVCDSLKQLPIQLTFSEENQNTGLATYFRSNLRQKVEKILEDVQKPDGTPYNLYRDGLKIYTTINSTMQVYAEEAVSTHLTALQKAFLKHTKRPYGSMELVNRLKKKSKRYSDLLKKGISPKNIDKNFATPVSMSVYDWKNGGSKIVKMAPIDSIKYYLSILNAGFLAMEPQTGKIRAWVGGVDFKYYKYDHVKSKRQVGSTFKPIVYAAALKEGIAPCDYISNDLTIYTDYDDWRPENAEGEYGGVYSMEGGLAHSVNTIAVNLLFQTGIDKVKNLATEMGISSEVPELPSIALGAVDVSLWDMVNVYGTFANRGVRPEPYYIDKITDSSGKILYKFMPEEHPFDEVPLEKDQADMMIHMLQSVVDSGTARRLRYRYHFDTDIAGKTGTTQNQTDGWFIGFTPNLVAGAWVGGEYPQVRFHSLSLGQGANTALPIWAEFMKRVYKNKKFAAIKKAKFVQPDSLVLARMDCPPFLEDMAMVDALYDEKNAEGESALDKFIGIFKPGNTRDSTLRVEKEREKIRKKNKKIERRNKRMVRKRKRRRRIKKFFDDLFK